MGHGIGKPLTEVEINQRFIELYNRERTPEDEKRIEELNYPAACDRTESQHLSKYYVISQHDLEESSNKFIKGFIPRSIRNLNAAALVQLKTSKNVRLSMEKLMSKKNNEQKK